MQKSVQKQQHKDVFITLLVTVTHVREIHKKNKHANIYINSFFNNWMNLNIDSKNDTQKEQSTLSF